jgi:hypothetical protein
MITEQGKMSVMNSRRHVREATIIDITDICMSFSVPYIWRHLCSYGPRYGPAAVKIPNRVNSFLPLVGQMHIPMSGSPVSGIQKTHMFNVVFLLSPR